MFSSSPLNILVKSVVKHDTSTRIIQLLSFTTQNALRTQLLYILGNMMNYFNRKNILHSIYLVFPFLELHKRLHSNSCTLTSYIPMGRHSILFPSNPSNRMRMYCTKNIRIPIHRTLPDKIDILW